VKPFGSKPRLLIGRSGPQRRIAQVPGSAAHSPSMKRLLTTTAGRSVASWTILNYIRLVRATSSWSAAGLERVEPLIASGTPFIFAFWHGRILMTAYAWPYERARVAMLISQHRDGDLIARTVAPFDVALIRGSSAKPGRRDKGGLAALAAMARALAQGSCVGVTPDGPKGPRMRAAAGIAHLARLTGAPVVPFAYSTSFGITLKTWDRLLAPLPFGRIHFVWGAPVTVGRAEKGDRMEEARIRIEDALNAVTAEADALAGRAPAAPAPAAARASAER